MGTEPHSHAETAVERLQPRLPASLYEVAWQYSLLDWYESMLSDDIDWDLNPEHLAYLTPGAQSDLFGENDSLIAVYADLSDLNDPRLRSNDDGGPVEITTYTEADRFRVGHAYPANKTSSMTDYSITTYKNADAHHIAGLRDDAWGTNNVRDRFTGWAQSEFSEATRERVDDEDAAILDALAAVGDDEAELDRLTERFLELAGGEDVEFDALITVRVRLPGESRYRYPGEIEVLNEVMVEKKRDRLESISVDDASGSGVGYVSGDAGDVTGGSPGLFGMYGKKQREHIPDLDPKGSDAWRIRGLDFDVAAAIAAVDSIIDDFYRGIGQNRRIYVLPYLTGRRVDISPEEFEWFYETVWEPLRAAESGSEGTFDDEVDRILRSLHGASSEDDPFDDVGGTEAWEKVRVASVLQVTGNPDRVYFDTLDATYRAGALEDKHNRVLDSPVFRHDGIFAKRPPASSSPLLGGQLRLHRQILYGGYFERTIEPTRSSRQAAETPTAGAIDDYRMQRVRRLLTGESLDQESLLECYVHQLVQDQREALDSDEGYIPFPRRSVVEQYVQLRALSEIDTLASNTASFRFSATNMTAENPSDRTERLENFIESHDALSASDREAVFVLGGLVGRITAYQHRKDITSTLVRRYPIDYLTKQTVQEVTKEVLQMDASYAEAEKDRSYWTNSRYHERLADAMLDSDPTDWSMTEAELQWVYSLGITYGLNDTSIDTETAEEPTTA